MAKGERGYDLYLKDILLIECGTTERCNLDGEPCESGTENDTFRYVGMGMARNP